jgi:hypothetical protein
MKINSFSYYFIVVVIFSGILLSVRHVVNSNRIIVSSEELINPTSIYWQVDEEDSLLRVKDPLYVDKGFILTEIQFEKYKNDSVIFNELYGESILNKGDLINLQPPFILWKAGMNDTIKVFKTGKTLNFVRVKSPYIGKNKM